MSSDMGTVPDPKIERNQRKTPFTSSGFLNQKQNKTLHKKKTLWQKNKTLCRYGRRRRRSGL